MNQRTQERRVGMVAIATLLIGGLLAGMNAPAALSWLPWGRGTYEILIEVDQAPGVGPNTPVRKNGLLIGRVNRVIDRSDAVVMSANIFADVDLYPQYTCQVRTSVLGDSTVEFYRTQIRPGSPTAPPGTIFRAVTISSNPLDMVANLEGDLSRTITALGQGVSKSLSWPSRSTESSKMIKGRKGSANSSSRLR